MGVIESDVTSSKKQKFYHEVTVRTGKEVVRHPLGVTALEALGSDNGVAARMDNEVVSLSQEIKGSEVELEPVPLGSPDGSRVLHETLKFLLKIAKHECAPDLAIIIGKPIGAAFYCMLTDRVTGQAHIPSEEQLQKLRDAMINIIGAAAPISRTTFAYGEAVRLLSATGAGFTAKMLADCNLAQVELLECRGMYHRPLAATMINTSMVPLDSFRLSAFKEGFLLEHLRCDAKTGQLRHMTYDSASSDLLYDEYISRLQWAKDVELENIAQLNSAIREGRSKKVIQAVEANCDRQFVEIAAQVNERKNVKLLLIAGPSSSGKTTFAMRLQVQLEALGFKPLVVSVDSFYKAWQDITSEGPHKVDWESLASLNLQQLNDVLITLMNGKEALIPEYDMKTSMPADRSHWKPMQLPSSGRGIIIMEGIHCLNPALTPAVPKEQKFQVAIAPIPALQLDAVHVLSGTTVRMLRRMVRDYLNRGRPVLTTLKQWPSVVAGEVNNIYPHQRNADAVMNSEIAYEMCALKVHVEPLLKTIKPTEKEYSEVRRLLQTLELFIALPTNIIPPQSLLREFVGGSWYYDYGGWYKGY